MSGKIKKILIANRGEIAVRIIRTCREMGIGTVAVYSDIDAQSQVVRLSDEAYPLNGSTAAETYLDHEKILGIARQSGSDAIHPGYGFLSENEDFAELVTRNKVVFIGPPASVIKRLGDKTAARELASHLGIPVIPGSPKALGSIQEVKEVADRIGYPLLLKAAGGGGGKGMRVVRRVEDLQSFFQSAQSEAQTAFGDNRVYLEKYISSPRHVEVQILADSHGSVVHLGERECSIQRRHQKIVEESPSVVVTEDLRRKITESAIKICQESGYINAGTVEFLLDDKRNYYFLEVNTRLQVEHPVTEMRTGLDLVREQIRIAEGERLGYSQDEIRFAGHSIECRIYAEDPFNGFFPSTGRIVHLRPPAGGFVREERGIVGGDDVTTHYDPLLSKLVTWGETRSVALIRMGRALREYELFGVRNNLSLCLWLMEHEKFKAGNFDTHFLEKEFVPANLTEGKSEWESIAALAAVLGSGGDGDSTMQGNGSTTRRQGWLRKREGELR